MPRPRNRSETTRSLTQPSKVAWFSRRRKVKPINPAAVPSAMARSGTASTSLTKRVVRLAVRRWIGIGELVQLANQRHRIGEVVAAERPDLDAGRAGHRETADRVVGIAEIHEATSRSG